MNFDNIVTGVSLLVALVALYYSTKKQASDVKNSDADTISKMFANFKEQEEKYEQLKKDFDKYKKDMDSQFAVIVSENVKLRAWARKLIKQLEAAGLCPVKYEE